MHFGDKKTGAIKKRKNSISDDSSFASFLSEKGNIENQDLIGINTKTK